MHALGLQRHPPIRLVLVIHTDIVDAGGQRRRLDHGVSSRSHGQPGAAGLHGGDDPLGDAGILERNQVIRGGVIGARLRLDGPDDHDVVEPRFAHAEDRVVRQRMRAAGVGAGLQRAGCSGHVLRRRRCRAGTGQQA